MPIPSPFHPRTAPLCLSYQWKDWSGYLAVRTFDTSHEREYHALRHGAGLLDATPLYKYEVQGPQAAVLLSRMTVRDITRLKVGRVTYLCWCDDRGKVVDDGTVTRLDEDAYRLTAAEPTYRRLVTLSRGLDVTVEESTHRLATLALQGPTSRDILRQVSDADLDRLRFFRATRARIGGLDAWITRTGYTGDLGYEIWVQNTAAVALWDALMAAGRAYAMEPMGLDALDVARIEAGFIMLHVDYFSAAKVVLESRKSSPFEIGLGWTVELEREPFVGQAALLEERARGPRWRQVGLVASWEALEALYDRFGLPPNLPAQACRDPRPVFSRGRQVGQATSHTWSPILKKVIALASIRAEHATPGTKLELEHTVEFQRQTVPATVVETPFFNPRRKRKP